MTTFSHALPSEATAGTDGDRHGDVPAASAESSVVDVRQHPAGLALVVLRRLEDDAVLCRAAEELRSVRLPDRLVVDLSEVTLLNPAVVDVLASSLLGPGHQDRRLCVVCARLTGRGLLRKWSGDSLEVFRTTGDALKALTHHPERGQDPVCQGGGPRASRYASAGPDAHHALIVLSLAGACDG